MTAGSCASSRWSDSEQASTGAAEEARTDQEDPMAKRYGYPHWSATLILALVLPFLAASLAQAQSGHPMLGGPSGVVKSSKGDLLEGMMVQLIAHKTAMRTTVYSDADGRYEFPKLAAGT